MSGGGTDNPAFSNDECQTSDNSNSTLENSHTESLQNSQITIENDYKTPIDETPSNNVSQKMENGHQQSFVSQHYVEPVRTSPEPQYKTETRIELPADNQEKISTPTKSNGVHGNGNNNDASFLNTSTASIQSNDGKKEQVEAVNLELVSMRPYSGANAQSKGQEACEVPADPYEEYFVPVNEHRKYIRGEKLYVTKDKRSRSSYWRRIACWGCGLLVLALAVIIAILAATGVILTQEATQPLESHEHTSSRQFGDINTSGSQEYMRNPPASPPPESSSLLPWPTTNETPYEIIPKAFDGTLALNDFNWTEELDDPKSRVYRDVSQEIEDNLKDMLHLAENLSVVKVYNISRDGEVKFRISYPPVSTPEQMQLNIEKMLQKSGSMIGKYHLSKLNIDRLIDDCKHGQLGCSESCRYDYSEGMFSCTCFSGRKIESDGKTCRDENDLSNVDMDDDFTHEQSTEFVQDIVQGRSRGPETTYSPKHQELDHVHSHFEEDSAGQQTNSEPEPTSEPKSEPEPTSEPKSEPEPTSGPKSEPEPTSEPKLEPESFTEPAFVPSPSVELEPGVGPTAEPKVEPEPNTEPKTEHEPSVQPEPTAEPSVEPEPNAEPKAEPEPSIEPEPTDEPQVEPEPTDEPQVEPEPTDEPQVEPEPTDEPQVEPEPNAEPKAEPEQSVESEPTAEPKAEPEPSVESEPTAEPKAEPEPSVEPEPNAEPKAEPEPSIIEPESTAERKSEPVPLFEPNLEPQSKGEPTPEPDTTAEPKSEPVPSVEPLSEPQPSGEPATEPKSEHTIVVESETKSSVEHRMEPESDQHNAATQPPMEVFTGLPNSSGFSSESVDQSEDGRPLSTVLPKSNEQSAEQTEPTITSSINLQPEENSRTVETQNRTQSIPLFSNIEPVAEYKPSWNESEHDDNLYVDHVSHIDHSNGMSRGFDSNNNDTYLLSNPQLQFQNNSYFGPGIEPDVPEIESSTTLASDFVLTDNSTNQFAPLPQSSDDSKSSDDSTVPSELSLSPVTEVVPSIESENDMGTNTERVEQSTRASGSEDSPDEELSFEGKPETKTTVEPLNRVSTIIEPTSQPDSASVAKLNSSETTNESLASEEPLSMTESSATTLNLSTIPVLQDTTEHNVIDHMPSTVYQSLPKTFGENIEPLIDHSENETASVDEHIMVIADTKHATPSPSHSVIPELSPEQIGSNHPTENSIHSDSELADISKTNNQHLTDQAHPVPTIELTTKSSTVQPEHSMVTGHPLYPIVSPENFVHSDKIELSEEKHTEDMSPFLPDIQHEKETSKKAPRLDKDEQDVPNPFETRIPDVIAHHPDLTSNDTKFSSSPNERQVMQNDTSFEPAIAEVRTSNPMNETYDSVYSAEARRNQVPFITSGLVVGDSENLMEPSSESPLSENSNDSSEKPTPTEVPTKYFSETNSLNDSAHVIDQHNPSLIDSQSGEYAANDSTPTDIKNEEQFNSQESIEEEEIPLRVIPLGGEPKEFDALPVKLQNENSTPLSQVSENEGIEVSTEETINPATLSKDIANISPDEKKIRHSDKSIVDYTERNFEDQYNDIFDEADSNPTKDFKGHNSEQGNSNIHTSNDTGSLSEAQDVTIAQPQSKPNLKENNEPVTEQSTEHNEVSHSADTELNVQTSTQNSPEQSDVAKDAFVHQESTTLNMVSDTTISPVTINHDHSNDAKLTTEVPILPVEIGQTVSVIETGNNSDQTTVTENHILQQSNDSGVIVNIEKSATTVMPPTTTHGSNSESHTTNQVPILPDEFQTTENEIFTTTPSVKVLQSADEVIDGNKKDEVTSEANIVPPMRNVDPASENENLHSELNTGISGQVTAEVKPSNETEISQANYTHPESTEIHADSQSAPVENVSTNLETPTSSSDDADITGDTVMNSATPTPMMTVDDIRPVSEAVIDDFKPYEFDYKQLFTSTEKTKPITERELTDEELRVIPLDKPDNKKKSVEKKSFDKYKHKKEKELNFGDVENSDKLSHDSGIHTTTMLSVEIPSTIVPETMNKEKDVNSHVPLVDTPRTMEAKNVMDDIRPVSEESDEMIPVMPPRTDSEIHLVDNETHTNSEAIDHLVSQAAANVTEQPVQKDENIVANTENGVIRETVQASEGNTPKTLQSSDDRTAPIIDADLTTPDPISLSNHSIAENDTKTITTELGVPAIDEDQMQQNSTTVESIDTHVQSSVQNPEGVEVIGNPASESAEISAIFSGNVTLPTEVPAQINQLFSKCTAGQFQCANGTSRDGAYCVSLAAKCDSENDCSDGSDEVNCEQEGCPGNFQCSSGQCLKRHLVCNGIKDCDDGSDEKSCAEWKCQFDEFQCPNGRCIPTLWQCNGRPDCEDHKDEYSCAESCGNNEYLCPTEKWCIPLTWHCNGIPECANGEDEKLCDCALDQFKCQTGGCVSSDLVCDGVEHCPDHSDEWDCLTANLTIAQNTTEIEKDDDSETHGDTDLVGQATILKIRQPNGERRLVCSDNWSTEFSDSFCKAQGYFSSENTEMLPLDEGLKLLKLKPTPDLRAPLVTNLQHTDVCETGRIVQISCQEFSCGSHYPEGLTGRLAGGTPAGQGQWSSVALLKEQKYGVACTASVLSPMYALASYSCIYKYRQSNGWQLFTGGDMLTHHQVKSIVPYPQVKYNQFLYNNDMALVELEEPLTFSRNVSAVCLPRHPIQPRQLCVTAGWGFPMNGEINLQQYLRFLPVPTYDSEECNATSHYAGFITKDNICAGFTDTDKGPCYNDEGAPLMCASETGRWELQGLLSHHSRCSRGHPAIYSSLAPALSWLHHSIPALQARP